MNNNSGSYPRYIVDKDVHTWVVREFIGFDHAWALYSKPIRSFNSKKDAQQYIDKLMGV